MNDLFVSDENVFITSAKITLVAVLILDLVMYSFFVPSETFCIARSEATLATDLISYLVMSSLFELSNVASLTGSVTT